MWLSPKVSIKRQSITIPKASILVIVVYLLFLANLINIGNYSFFSYTFSGASASNPLFSALIYLRLPLAVFGGILILAFLFHDKSFRSSLIKNIDVLLFGGMMFLGLFNSKDMVNGILYSIWHMSSFIVVLTFLFLLNKNFNPEIRVRFFFQFLFWSNFIVIPLLVINLSSLGQQWSYYMAFSSKAFYPYCLLSMIISIYSSRLLTGYSIFNYSKRINGYLELILILLIIFFCFVSARRTPLFLIILLSVPYTYFRIGRRVWKKATLFILTICLIVFATPKVMKFIDEHKYEMSVLKKINDLQASNGDLSKDSSYNERKQIWNSYIEVFEKHPAIGVGSYNGPLFQTMIVKNSNLAGFSTHNLYLGILVEHGVIGFFFFILMIICSLFKAIRKIGIKKSLIWISYGLVPILLINWNEYNLLPGQVFYWTTILILLFPRLN